MASTETEEEMKKRKKRSKPQHPEVIPVGNMFRKRCGKWEFCEYENIDLNISIWTEISLLTGDAKLSCANNQWCTLVVGTCSIGPGIR